MKPSHRSPISLIHQSISPSLSFPGGTQTVRLTSPTTLLKSPSNAAGKQVITVHKPGSALVGGHTVTTMAHHSMGLNVGGGQTVAGGINVTKAGGQQQPQIVTLVKTQQGVTLATMPKVSLIQPGGTKSSQTAHVQASKAGGGTTIVKLVTTQAGATGSPAGTKIIQSQQNPTILSMPGGQQKVSTIIRTLPSNMVTVAKPSMGVGTGTINTPGKGE